MSAVGQVVHMKRVFLNSNVTNRSKVWSRSSRTVNACFSGTMYKRGRISSREISVGADLISRTKALNIAAQFWRSHPACWPTARETRTALDFPNTCRERDSCGRKLLLACNAISRCFPQAREWMNISCGVAELSDLSFLVCCCPCGMWGSMADNYGSIMLSSCIIVIFVMYSKQMGGGKWRITR